MHFTRSILKTTTLWAGMTLSPLFAFLPTQAFAAPNEETNAPLEADKLRQFLADAEKAEQKFDWEGAGRFTRPSCVRIEPCRMFMSSTSMPSVAAGRFAGIAMPGFARKSSASIMASRFDTTIQWSKR